MPRQTKTREHILEIAAELFGAYGLSGVSTRQIAREAKVTKTLIFYHFQSKENLYLTVFRDRIGTFRQRIESMLVEHEPGLHSIEAFVRMQIEFLSENRNMIRILMRELIENDSRISDEPSAILKESIELLRPMSLKLMQSLMAAQEKGDIRDVDPAQTMVNIISLNIFFFWGQPILRVINPSTASQEFQKARADHVLDLLLNGLRERTE
jgi:AcrR family transcriptional regulator